MTKTPVSIAATAELDVSVQVTLSEKAASALHTLALFDQGAFQKAAQASYGNAWGKAEEEGMAELFEVALKQVSPIMRRAKDAREVFAGKREVK